MKKQTLLLLFLLLHSPITKLRRGSKEVNESEDLQHFSFPNSGVTSQMNLHPNWRGKKHGKWEIFLELNFSWKTLPYSIHTAPNNQEIESICQGACRLKLFPYSELIINLEMKFWKECTACCFFQAVLLPKLQIGYTGKKK